MLLQKEILTQKLLSLKIISKKKKVQTFDSSYFKSKSHFEEDGTQNYLVFQPIYRYFKTFSITQHLEYVSEWKSKGLSNESFKTISTSDDSLNPTLNYYSTKIKVKFTGDCLKQQKITYNKGKVVIFILFIHLVLLVLTIAILQ